MGQVYHLEGDVYPEQASRGDGLTDTVMAFKNDLAQHLDKEGQG